MGDLKHWNELARPYKVCRLWNGKEDAEIRVQTIPASKQLEIYEKVTKHYNKKELQGADSEQNRNLLYNQLLCYEATRDMEGKKLGSFEEFCNTVDGETIDRITKAYNQMVIAKTKVNADITEERMKLLEKYVNTFAYEDFDGLVTFHLNEVLTHIESMQEQLGIFGGEDYEV